MIGGFEVRAARVRVPGALHERQPPLVEDVRGGRPAADADRACDRLRRCPPAAPAPAGTAIVGRRL